MAELPFKESAKHIPLDGVMTFGAFKGKTIQQVADERASYLVWAIENVSWFEITRDARKYAQRRLCEQRQALIDRAAYRGILPSSPDGDGDDETDFGFEHRPDTGWPEMANYHDSDSW
jgi:hypothetical protein